MTPTIAMLSLKPSTGLRAHFAASIPTAFGSK